MDRYCSAGETLRQEYLASLSELVEAIKAYGKFAGKTKLVSARSAKAHNAWEGHSRYCIACYKKWKLHQVA